MNHSIQIDEHEGSGPRKKSALIQFGTVAAAGSALGGLVSALKPEAPALAFAAAAVGVGIGFLVQKFD